MSGLRPQAGIGGSSCAREFVRNLNGRNSPSWGDCFLSVDLSPGPSGPMFLGLSILIGSGSRLEDTEYSVLLALIKSGTPPGECKHSPGVILGFCRMLTHPVAACRRQARSGACVQPMKERFQDPFRGRRSAPRWNIAFIFKPKKKFSSRFFVQIGLSTESTIDRSRGCG